MGRDKDKVPAKDIKKAEKAANAKGSKEARRYAAQLRAERIAASRRAATKDNNPDDEPWVQIHKTGR